MVPPSIRRGLKVDATIQAHPAVVGGVRGVPVDQFDLKVAPLDSVSTDLIERFRIEAPLQKRVTYAYVTQVISTGMYLKIGSRSYPISGIGSYNEGAYTFYEIIVDDIKAS